MQIAFMTCLEILDNVENRSMKQVLEIKKDV